MRDDELKISQHLGFGCVGLSAMNNYYSARSILEKSYQYGITYYDTAPLYGRGYSELIIKDFIKNKRQHITVATKFGLGEPGMPALPAQLAVSLNTIKKTFSSTGHKSIAGDIQPLTNPGLHKRDINLQDVVNGLHNSLKRLGTDYIDYYLLHEGIPSFLTREAFDYLLSVKEKGVIKKIGLAINAFHLLALHPSDVNDWDVLQYESDDELSQQLRKKYPSKEHIHHSCLKYGLRKATDVVESERGGYVLSLCAQNNTTGKILFSTKSISRLGQNINAFKKYSGQ